MRGIWLTVLALLAVGPFRPTRAQVAHYPTNAGNGLTKQGPVFIENKGQYVADVKFLYRSKGLDMWILGNAVVYDIHRDSIFDANGNQIQFSDRIDSMGRLKMSEDVIHRSGTSIRMVFENASSSLTASGEAEQAGINNYLIGNDSTKWATNVHRFGEAHVQNLYDGIDASYYLDNGLPRYDLIVQPGSDPSKICITFEGQEHLSVAETGNLIMRTSIGDITQQGLYAYQIRSEKKEPVACRFSLDESEKVRFEVGSYDRSLPLIIDPLIYSTYLGGAFDDYTSAVAVDNKGNAFIAGESFSGGTLAYPAAYPATPGAYQVQSLAQTFGYVSKLNPDGSALIYSTYIGTSNGNTIYAMALDTSGDVFIVGTGDVPVTPGAYLTSKAKSYLTKLNPSGNSLLYSTYFGGGLVGCLAIDRKGCAYIAGQADPGFPTTPGAYKSPYPPSQEFLFVTKFNAAGSGLVYATCFGSTGFNAARGIALDTFENVYITGATTNPAGGPYPTTSGAFQSSTKAKFGNEDAFVTKLNSTGSVLVYSTLLGGGLDQKASDIAVDAAGNAYVMGWTTSTDGSSGNFPTTPNAFQLQTPTPSSNAQDVFVTKLNATGTALLYSTLLGGEDVDIGIGFTIDTFGNAYIAGRTKSHLYPTTADAFQLVNSASGYEAMLTELNATGSGLLYSTYLGGEADNMAMGIAVDSSGDIYVAGHTSSAGAFPVGFPVTAGVFQPQNSGSYDAFVMKFGPITGGRPEILSYQLDTLSLSVCDSAEDSVSIFNLGGGRITIDSAHVNQPFYLPGGELPNTLSAGTPLILHTRIIPETAGPTSAPLTVYYHTSDGKAHDTVIVLNSNIRGPLDIGVQFGPRTLSGAAGETVQLLVSLTGNLDSATAVSAGLKTLTISLNLNANRLRLVGVFSGLPGVSVSEPVVNDSSVTFTITFPAGFNFNTIADLATVSCAPYLTDTNQTVIRLTGAQFDLSNPRCLTLGIPDDSSTFTLLRRCGDSTILQFMKSEVLVFDRVTITPNPAASQVQILFRNVASSPISYQIVDLLGTIRAEGETSGDALTLDVLSLANGLHYLRLRNPTIAASATGRFMIQR